MTGSIVELRPYKLTHTEDCEDLMVGRAWRDISDEDGDGRPIEPDAITARVDFLRLYEPEGRCDCAATALRRVENSLRMARKGVRAVQSCARADIRQEAQDRVTRLVVERDAIKSAMA